MYFAYVIDGGVVHCWLLVPQVMGLSMAIEIVIPWLVGVSKWESLYTQIMIRVYTILKHIDKFTLVWKFLLSI